LRGWRSDVIFEGEELSGWTILLTPFEPRLRIESYTWWPATFEEPREARLSWCSLSGAICF